MTDDRNLSNDIGEDPEVDAMFASAGRFPTQTGFEDRVLRVVALPLPDWALKIRTLKSDLLQSRAGQVALAGLALGTVTSLTFLVRWVKVNGSAAGQWVGSWVGAPSWPSLRTLVASMMDTIAGALPAGLATRTTALIGAAVVGVSAIGLYITAGPPAVRSRHAR
jgi:hypothetical protein